MIQEKFVLKKENLHAFLEALSKDMEVFVPCHNENGATTFLPYNGQEIYTAAQTFYSPKQALNKPSEKEFFFGKKSSSVEVERVKQNGGKMIFGIRPCDTHAVKAFDKLYLEYGEVDPFYREKRDSTLLAALVCTEPCSNGFCHSMGTQEPTGHDLLMVEKADSFYIEAASSKGEELIKKHRGLLNITKFQKPELNFECKKKLDTRNLKEILDKGFFSKVWEEEGKRDLNCTSCTQVCPSCYCFLTLDKFILNTENSERFREWDSCHLQRFTKVAGNHIFRKSRESRLRQFVMHKLSYFQKNNDMMLCIGCGRCISVCPVGIDLTEIAAKIRSEFE